MVKLFGVYALCRVGKIEPTLTIIYWMNDWPHQTRGGCDNFWWKFAETFTSFFCLIVFTSDHQTFCIQFKVRQHFIGCINHYIVVGLFFDLFLRLSYYVHPGYGKKWNIKEEVADSCGIWTRALSNRSRMQYKIYTCLIVFREFEAFTTTKRQQTNLSHNTTLLATLSNPMKMTNISVWDL